MSVSLGQVARRTSQSQARAALYLSLHIQAHFCVSVEQICQILADLSHIPLD